MTDNNPDMGLADSLLKSYLEVLTRLQYIEREGVTDYLYELARVNDASIHDFVVASMVDFVVGLQQEPPEGDDEEIVH